MKAFLHHTLVKTKIKPDFLVQVGDNFKMVDSIDNGEVTFPDKTTCPESELEGKVVKLLAIVAGNTPYSIFNRDYDMIFDIFNEHHPEYGNKLRSYLHGERIELVGNVIHKTVSVENGNIVRLTNIRHIDKYSLYEYSSRMATIIEYKDYYYNLKCGTHIIKCKREDFTVIDTENFRSFFQIKCTHCNR